MQLLRKASDTGFQRGIALGVMASIVGTILMDLTMVAQYTMAGMPALTYLLLIGGIFGGTLGAGLLVHLVTTVALGVIFSVPVLTIDALRIDSLRKGLLVGTVFGVLSIAACVPVAFLIKESVATVLSFMAIPHVVWGIGVGIVAGLTMPSLAARGRS